MKQEVYIENMKCNGCAETVKERFEGIPSVERVLVDIDEQKAVLETAETVHDNVLTQALEGTKFKVKNKS